MKYQIKENVFLVLFFVKIQITVLQTNILHQIFMTKMENGIKNIILHLKDRGLGVLITDHNVRETLDVCECAYIVSHGKIIAQGEPAAVHMAPQPGQPQPRRGGSTHADHRRHRELTTGDKAGRITVERHEVWLG